MHNLSTKRVENRLRIYNFKRVVCSGFRVSDAFNPSDHSAVKQQASKASHAHDSIKSEKDFSHQILSSRYKLCRLVSGYLMRLILQTSLL